MPNTDQPTTTSSIVSPSPNPLSKARSFTMTNFSTITEYSFKFSQHSHGTSFHTALNNTYAELFEDTVVNRLFMDDGCTTIAINITIVLRTTIIDTILLSSQSDYITIASIVKHVLLFSYLGLPI